jgi:hypothetical protein
MNNKKINKYFLFSFFFGFLMIIAFGIIQNKPMVQEVSIRNTAIIGSYVPLEPIPGLTTTSNAGETFGTMLSTFYRWGISIAVILSIVMIMYGGLEYMTSESIQKKSNGRNRIQGAIVGLLLALSSYLILKEINPDIVDFDSNLFINPNL